MAMGTRKKRERQEDLWMVSSDVVGTPAHAFYDRLNQVLDQHHFDRNVEHLCKRYYTGRKGDRKSTRLNSSHGYISYAVFCLKKKKKGEWVDGRDSTHRQWPR